jgi:protein-disulfide isomerase
METVATRVEDKRRAREARLAAEAAQQRADARRRSLLRLGIVAGVALVAVVAAVLVSRGGGGSGAAGGDRAAQTRQVSALFGGLQQHGTQLGDPKARFTLVEFADLQCPICKRYTDDVLPSVVKDYVRTGRVKLDLKLRTFIGPDSVTAAKVAAGAAQQSRIWPFADLFYRNQGTENSGYVTQDFLKGIAQGTPGLDAQQALSAAGSAKAQKLLQSDETLAGALQSVSTPDFYVRLGDGGPLRRVNWQDLTPKAFASALDAAMGQQS